MVLTFYRKTAGDLTGSSRTFAISTVGDLYAIGGLTNGNVCLKIEHKRAVCFVDIGRSFIPAGPLGLCENQVDVDLSKGFERPLRFVAANSYPDL
jgi:hypothetical protein